MQWELVGWAAAVLTMFGFVPQILKIHRTRSVEDVSLLMLLQFSLGIFLWMVYGLYLQDKIIITANAISLITLVTAVGLYMRYRKSYQSAVGKN
jgi:MtN3 and saliva related transmembrane protein